MQLMYDMLLLAFQTIRRASRVSSSPTIGDNRSTVRSDSEGHTTCAHQNSEQINKVAEIDKWYSKQLARFLLKMQETKDIDAIRCCTIR